MSQNEDSNVKPSPSGPIACWWFHTLICASHWNEMWIKRAGADWQLDLWCKLKIAAVAFLASDNTASPVSGVVSGTTRADESFSYHLDISVNLDPLKQTNKQNWAAAFSTAASEWKGSVPVTWPENDLEKRRKKWMAGWKWLCSRCPLPMKWLKIKPFWWERAMMSLPVGGRGWCQTGQGSNCPLTCTNSERDVTASYLTTAIKSFKYVLRRTMTSAGPLVVDNRASGVYGSGCVSFLHKNKWMDNCRHEFQD